VLPMATEKWKNTHNFMIINKNWTNKQNNIRHLWITDRQWPLWVGQHCTFWRCWKSTWLPQHSRQMLLETAPPEHGGNYWNSYINLHMNERITNWITIHIFAYSSFVPYIALLNYACLDQVCIYSNARKYNLKCL